jgi:hypothetical protein
MKFSNAAAGATFLILALLSAILVGGFPRVHAPTTGGNTYTLNAVPATGQEGTTISLVLTVTLGIATTGSTIYSFRFNVRDPAGQTFQSHLINYTTIIGQTQFSVVVAYPSSEFPGINSLAGTYSASVDEVAPTPTLDVANTTFVLSSTDNTSYERTQTVNIQATGYNASESVYLSIEAQTTSTIVYSQGTTASPLGVVTAKWRIPPSATIENYIAFLNGTTTHKNPPDNVTFAVRTASISISALSSEQTIYQRTQTMNFYFQPAYPDLSIPTTGVGLVNLENPSHANITLTATYDNNSQTFNATYDTFTNNQTGTWIATLAGKGYSDAYGNTGPSSAVTSSPQLAIATLSVTVSTSTTIAVGQQLEFNATVDYPDGTLVTPATVKAYLIYSGTPSINDTIPIVYDSNLGHWVGTYTAKPADTGGLWSLVIYASDSSSPANTGTATRAITVQNTTTASSPAGFPLFYFEILAAIIAGLLTATLLLFRRRRVGHTSLKIDLDAVHSEAGRIESQDFFKTIKEQVRKDMDDKAQSN